MATHSHINAGCKSRLYIAPRTGTNLAIALSAALISGSALAGPKASLSEIIVQLTRASCAELSSVKLRDTTIVSATSIPAGSFTPPGNATLTDLPAFCRVVGVVYPTINFEVWLPVYSSWNGKFAASGSGGTGGYINYGQLPSIKDGMAFNLRRGYTAAATDQGHTLAAPTWLLDPGRLVDWGSRANHEVTLRAKELIKAFYGTAPKYSYFEGCSGGGQQALMEAQRYPDDFDGIVAGAPANNWSALMVGELWNGAATLKDPASNIPASKLPLINNAVLAACDVNDGLKDGVLTDPTKCQFDPGVLLCSGTDSSACLTAPQVAGLRKLYQGPTNPRTGEQIYPALSPGGELNWSPTVAGPLPTGSTTTWFTWGVFEDPSWDWKSFDYDQGWEKARAKLSYINDSIDPDLRPFRDSGGKLIMWHGWGDYLIASQNSVNYYNSVVNVVAADGTMRDALRNTQKFARLFMNPGLGHCAGGPGTETFDPLAALEQWVERDIEPDQIVSSHVEGGTVKYSRPLCAYPTTAFFKGGDQNSASNFECRAPSQ